MVFEIVAQKLAELGFYNFFLPFILVAAILYGILSRTKVLGESVVINGVISLGAALIIFGLPVLIGVSIAAPLTSFISSSVAFILIMVVGLVVAGLFLPSGEKLFEAFKGWHWIFIVIFIIAGLSGLFGIAFRPAIPLLGIKKDLLLFMIIFILVFLPIIIFALTRK